MRTPLTELRRYVESLSTETGEYVLCCARTGESPVPADGLRFDSRERARAAAAATRLYRATLRRYDPAVPYRDPVVDQRPAEPLETDREPAVVEG
mgnify:CR=1 FL=1